jgi:hypothetical protein
MQYCLPGSTKSFVYRPIKSKVVRIFCTVGKRQDSSTTLSLACTTGQLYASDNLRNGKAVFGSESDPQFSGKVRADMTKFCNVGRDMHDFPIVVNSIRGSIPYG